MDLDKGMRADSASARIEAQGRANERRKKNKSRQEKLKRDPTSASNIVQAVVLVVVQWYQTQ